MDNQMNKQKAACLQTLLPLGKQRALTELAQQRID
jgi:hypothetical protein